MNKLHTLQTIRLFDKQYPVDNSLIGKWRTCVVLKEYPTYYLVVMEDGGYKTTILKADMYIGKAEVKAGRLC